MVVLQPVAEHHPEQKLGLTSRFQNQVMNEVAALRRLANNSHGRPADSHFAQVAFHFVLNAQTLSQMRRTLRQIAFRADSFDVAEDHVVGMRPSYVQSGFFRHHTLRISETVSELKLKLG